MDPLVDDRQAAKFIHKSVQSLRNDRYRGVGLPYVKLGPGKKGAVRYRITDILEYIEKHLINPSK